MTYPLRHISVRVPWHDTGWDGRVCAAPHLNGACLTLKRIAESRDDALEDSCAGQSIKDLPPEKWPACVVERAGFMAPFEYIRKPNHPYNNGPETAHGHFKDTPLRHPPYSVPAVPFYWMLRENMSTLAEEYALDAQDEREPNLFKGAETWVQDFANQKALLECFRGHLKPEQSLCFFYAKRVPFAEFAENAPNARFLIGVGRVLHVAPPQEYSYLTQNLDGKLRSHLWELMVQHSIRPDFKDGFLLPYHAAIAKAAADPDFDPADVVALSPADRLPEFSYASQLVTHDGAIGGLLACAQSLHKVKAAALPGEWGHCLEWIDARLAELWKVRGPCPGLGAALSAFGVGLGAFVAQAIIEQAGEDADPWPFVDKMFKNPKASLPQQLAGGIDKTLCATWDRLSAERRSLLKLLSRFEISRDQAEMLFVQEERGKAGISRSDAEIITNPYILYESTRLTPEPISVWTADRGVFPVDAICKKHPLPEPSALEGGTEARRVRAFTVNVLEEAAVNGNTLLPQDQIVLSIRGLPLQPPCPVNGDMMEVAKDIFGSEVNAIKMGNGAPALQLKRLADAGSIISTSLEKRIKGKRLVVDADWCKRLDAHLARQAVSQKDVLESSAREEKTAALKEIAESRLSVLIGPAGTGKTTLLSILCSHPTIASGGILLLAPTGKARVRMEQATKDLQLNGYTIAQFLSPDRYDNTTGRYRLSDKPKEVGERTVIVDECSMLTEEMLAALLDALKGVHRLILIGDPRQLPPIGAGRPFVDIVAHLAPPGVGEKFPRVGPGYAELTIRRRQIGEDREDLRLAEWFSGAFVPPGEDDIFDTVLRTGQSNHVRFVQWESPDDLRKRLIETLVHELRLKGPTDIAGFDATFGCTEWNEMRFFNFGAAQKTESWQILSPVRSGAAGVPDLNRLIHKQFRQELVEASRKIINRKYPKPMGPEEIVYGDKVINLMNTDPALYWNSHRKVYPSKDKPYIANGEIGMAIGYFWRKGKPDFRWKLEIEFSSQPNHKYDFTSQDFGEEGNPVLELAYALTVHKSQGSEFGTVILVLPNPCRLLSRELLYTALTRQKDHVVILHQGLRTDLRRYSSDDRSETARRLTNLFAAPLPRVIDGRLYEDRLIHRTARGEMVRSKSEVIIADHLAAKDIPYSYEQQLTLDGVSKYPDFTIEDAESGNIFYWEHCGMLHMPTYRRRWEDKLAWYEANGILPQDKGGGPAGSLIITRDEADGSIDSAKIFALIENVFNA